MNRFFIFLSFFIFGFVLTTKAQNGCEQNVKQAEDLYNSGDYDNCILIIEKSIKECNLSSKMKEGALELLVKSYLEQDNITKAEASVHDLLKNNPHYELKETDSHEDFNILINKFDVHPLFTIGITNSLFHPQFKTTKTYSILENVDYTAPYATVNTILLYYPWVEYEFIKNLSVKADIISLGSIYYDRSFSRGTDWTMIYHENLSFIEIPVCLKKQFPIGKNIIPYASFGIGYLMMYQANGSASITYTNEDVFTGNKTPYMSTESANMLSMRNQNSFEWIAGAGFGYKFKNLGIFLDATYCGGLNSITNSAKRFNNTGLTNDYFYIDNSVKLNNYEIGISISYTIKNLIKKVR